MGAKTYVYERRLQLKHFFEDRNTGQTRRTWCEMQVAMPEKTVEGWVNPSGGSYAKPALADIDGDFENIK